MNRIITTFFSHTSSFLLLASVLLVIGAVNGRILADQRTLEKDLFVATNYVTQPNEQTRHIKEEHEEEHEQEELSRKADNDDDLEDIIDYHKFETATHSPIRSTSAPLLMEKIPPQLLRLLVSSRM